MDPEAVTEQIKILQSLIDTTLNVLAQHNHELEGVFVHRNIVLDQVTSLEAVVEDSIKLHAESKNTSREFALLQPAFLREQIKNVGAVAQDMRWLGKPGAGSKKLRLQMMSDTFILNLMRGIYNPAVENIDICGASEDEVDVRSLNVMQPEFVKRLMRWLLQVAESHVAQNKDAATYIDFRDSAESTMAALREEAATIRAADAAMRTEMKELEAATQTKVNELETAMRTKVTELETAMRTKVSELEATIGGLQRERNHLEAALQTAHFTRRGLDEEKRRLEETYKASEAAARAALESAQGEAATLRAVNADCGRKIAEQILQLSRLQEQIDARDGELAALKVKPVAPSRGERTSSLSYAGSDKAEEEEEEEEGGEGKDEDEEEGEIQQVDEEMKDAAEVLEAELQDTKAKLQATLKKVARLEVELVLSRGNLLRAGGTSTQSAPAGQISPSITSLNLTALGLLALPHRARALAQLPEVHVDLPPKLSGMYSAFTRASINATLGGSMGGFLVRCTNSQTELARDHDISSFLCLNMDMNPWLPAAPGRHGYMQIGFEQDLKLLLDGQNQHIFVGAARWFFYCGEYRVRRVDDLTIEEWNMLPLPTKVVYAEHTLTKKLPSLAGESLTIKDVLERYEIGDLRLPCVQLECIGFDRTFYKAIIRENMNHRRYSGAQTISLDKAGGSGKRRRVEAKEVQDDEDN